MEIRGICPIYKIGDKITICDPIIDTEKSNALCTHALSSLLHYSVALENGTDSVKLGLSRPDDKKNAYIQCLDPGPPYTRGGTVIFRIKRINQEKKL